MKMILIVHFSFKARLQNRRTLEMQSYVDESTLRHQNIYEVTIHMAGVWSVASKCLYTRLTLTVCCLHLLIIRLFVFTV